MKKKAILVFAIAIALISGYVGNSYNKAQTALNQTLANCEALAECEVINGSGEVIVECEGDSGVCYDLGGGFYCPGKKIRG